MHHHKPGVLWKGRLVWSRSRSQQRLKMWKNVHLDDDFWIAECSLTMCVVMRHHYRDWRAKRWVAIFKVRVYMIKITITTNYTSFATSLGHRVYVIKLAKLLSIDLLQQSRSQGWCDQNYHNNWLDALQQFFVVYCTSSCRKTGFSLPYCNQARCNEWSAVTNNWSKCKENEHIYADSNTVTYYRLL